MSESVNLPALGESVTEGTVTRWLKKVGDRVSVDEPLLEVSTDKVDTEIPSPIAGVIEAILVAEDETVEVGTALVTIGDGAGAAASGSPDSESAGPDNPAGDVPAADASAEGERTASHREPFSPEQAEPAPEAQGQGATAPDAPAPDAPGPDAQGSDAPESYFQTASYAGQSDTAQIADAAAAPMSDESPATAPPLPDSPVDLEVPSTDAPAPDETSGAHGPAPVEEIDPAPIEAAHADEAPPQETTPEQAPAPDGSAGEGAADERTAEEASGAGTGDPHAGYVTPLVRKLANENGIDLAAIPGTGVGGRIRRQDVLVAMEPVPEQANAQSDDGVIAAAEAPTVGPEVSALRGTTVPMSRLRRVIAERAVISMQSSAQLTSVVEVDVTLVAQYRNLVKSEFAEKTGVKLSFLPFFALAAAEALTAYPIVNATIDGDSIVYPPHENISIAVDTERGLLTPVIRDAAGLSLAGFATQIADLATRTRENRLKPDELAGGTFTLTNTGSRGALFDTPIVFLPQSAILGTGIVAKRPVVVSDSSGDAIAVRSMVYLALSYDHRIVDGADAARFLVAVKERLEGGNFEGNLGI